MKMNAITVAEPKKLTNVEDIYPMSPMQQGILFHCLYEPGTGMYCLQLGCQIEAALDVRAFRRAWEAVLGRHAILRTSFLWEGLEKPRQVVRKNVELPWREEDWRGYDQSEQQARWQKLLTDERNREFDFKEAPLMRVALIRTGEERYYFAWNGHHILLDGWCWQIVMGEALTLYAAYREGRRPQLPSPRLYRDYIVWLQKQDEKKAEAFWREDLRGFILPTRLGIERGGQEAVRDGEGFGSLTGFLNREHTAKLDELARRQQVTASTIVQSAWAIVLGRYSGERDVAFGATVSGRSAAGGVFETSVGLFINTLPVRVQLRSEESVSDLQKRIQERQARGLDYEYSPLMKVQEWSEVPRGTPLFESIVVFENIPVNDALQQWSGTGFKLSDVSIEEINNYPLSLVIRPGQELTFKFNYNRHLYDEQSLQRVLGHFRIVLEQIVGNPEVGISEVSLLTEREREQVVEEWNQTGVEYPQGCVHEVFAEQAGRTPEAIAVAYEGEKLTYAELNRRANQMGHYLQKVGVGPEVRVGICLERSLEMVIGLLGILKAGGAYVPLDAEYPAERLQFMMEDAQVAVLLTEKKFQDVLPGAAVEICLDEERERIAEESEEAVEVKLDAGYLAYVIYTSGSTGRPKGVGVEHGSIVRLVKGANYVEMKEEDVFLQMAPVSFDAATFEIWGSLLNGSCLAVYPAGVGSLEELGRVVERQGVTVLWLTAGLFHHMVDTQVERLQGVRQLLAGGDVLSVAHVRRVLREVREIQVINGYGPTENTTFSCCHGMRGEEGQELGETVPIGRPISNSQAYVLEEMGNEPVAVGIVGELYVGGAGLARGYLNRPELTAEKFVPNQFSEKGGERLYRTGDRARWREDGKLEFLGRMDHQVKIRGFRIELGEIERALEEHGGVEQAVVVAREDQPGEKRLVGYVVMRGEEGDVNGVRSYLKERLPDYMVPGWVVKMEALPLTANGKVDRKALPAPEVDREEGGYVGPRNQTEEILCGLWEDLLGVGKIGVEDNFFEVGGHSLSATQLILRIRNSFAVELPLRRLFESPTVAEVGQMIEEMKAEGGAGKAPPIVKVSRETEIPLSYAQQRLWFLDQLQPGSAAYNVPVGLRLDGVLQMEVLERAFTELVRRHEALRTTFQVKDGEAVQVIAPAEAFVLALTDLSLLAAEEREAEAQRLAQAEAITPFDLGRGPLLRVKMVRMAEQQHVLLLTMHHIVTDAWSIGIMIREIAQLYEVYLKHGESGWPELKVQYADYAVWQRQWLQGEVLDQQMSYWEEQLADLPQVHSLPLDRSRPAVETFHGAEHTVEIEPATVEALKKLSVKSQTTLFMTLHGVFALLLSRYANSTDIVMGTPVANRLQSELESMVGFFVNTLVLRTECSPGRTFREYLAHVREVNLEAHAHQDVPFEHVVARLQPQRSTSFAPLFQIMFSINQKQAEAQLPGLSTSPLRGEDVLVKFDLMLDAFEQDGGLRLSFAYASDLFEASTIERMGEHMKNLLQAAAANPDGKVEELPMLSEAEQHHLIYELNQTTSDYRLDTCVHKLFEAQVERNPGATAVTFEGQRLSYEELNRQANQLAHYLVQLGVGPEARVGICMERSLEMVIGLLGILKAGGAYVPLDPTYPTDRLSYMLQDAQTEILLIQSKFRGRLLDYAGRCIELDGDWHVVARESGSAASSRDFAATLAYVIYTSGSTGKPKGVAVEHRQVCNQLFWAGDALSLGAADRVLQKASFSFDASILEIFLPLACGAQIVMAKPGGEMDVDYLVQLAIENEVTYVDLVPALLEQLVEHPAIQQWTSLRVLSSGADVLKPELVKSFYRRLPGVLWNTYGPTEATVQSTFTECGEHERTVAIGKPIANTQIYVLDDSLEPVPAGVAGELYIGGAGVTRGYLNQPVLTADRFLPDRFSATPGARLYRTGDLARWRADGNVEYLGRADFQVKIRGFRIELGEIETALEQHGGIEQAVVVAREDQPGEKRLIAYIVGKAQAGDLTENELRNYLKHRLPEYLVPAAFMRLERLPLTRNGKLDRKGLPLPAAGLLGSGSPFVAPRNLLEKQLADMWEDLLQKHPVSMTDNFFDLGGHSILAVRLAARIEKQLGRHLPVTALFSNGTVETLAQFLQKNASDEPWSPLVPIQTAGNNPPLFFVHAVGGQVLSYMDLGRHLGQNQPFYGLQSRPAVKGLIKHASLEEMAAEYVKAIRAFQPVGPYRLGGWSMGGVIAFEMARQMEQQGQEVALLALVDSYAPSPTLSEATYTDDLAGFALHLGFSYERIMAAESAILKLLPSEHLAYVFSEAKASGMLPADTTLEDLSVMWDVFSDNSQLLSRYRGGRYQGKATLFRAEQSLGPGLGENGFIPEDPERGWGIWASGGVEVIAAPGNHFTMIQAPQVDKMAEQLLARLEEAAEEQMRYALAGAD
jgi:amino acid adenylation domain-containing protein